MKSAKWLAKGERQSKGKAKNRVKQSHISKHLPEPGNLIYSSEKQKQNECPV